MKFFEDLVASLVGHMFNRPRLPTELPSHVEVNRELSEAANQLRALNQAQEHQQFKRIREEAAEVGRLAREAQDELRKT